METQPRTDQYAERKAGTKRKLREALARLRAGAPLNPAVQARRWRLDVRTLAQEAGVSRNAIYQNHADVIEELRRATSASADDTKQADSEKERLQKALREAEQNERLLVTNNAELLARALRAETDLRELRAHQHRLSKA